MIQKTILRYLVLQGAGSFATSFSIAVYVMFLKSQGLNDFQRNMVNVSFYVTLFCFEIPTGSFADVFGRKASYVVSQLLRALGYFIYAASTNVWHYIGAEMSAAIGMTFASGAFEAWVVDETKHHGYEGSVRPIIIKGQYTGCAFSAVGAIIGAFCASYNLRFAWIGGGIACLISALLAVALMYEGYFVPVKYSITEGLRVMKQTAIDSYYYGIKNASVRFVLVIGTLQFFAVSAPNMQWQPFFGKYFHGTMGLGYMGSGIMLMLLVGTMFARRLHVAAKNETRALLISQTGIGVCLIAIVLMPNLLLGSVVFLAHEVLRGVFKPLKDAYLHDQIPSEQRATIISFESIAHHVGGGIGLIFTGAVAQLVSPTAAWIFAGLVLIVGSLLVGKNGKS